MVATREERHISGPDQSVQPGQRSGGARLALVLTLVAVLALLGLLGAKLAAGAGWFQAGAGAARSGAVRAGGLGIFTSGQLVKIPFRRAPDFGLQLYSGEQLRLADLRGRPVLVNFWASWCPPCRQEAPLLERTWREYREQGVVFVGVNIWDREQDARKFLKDFDITFPTGPDPRGQVSIDYGLTGIPETFFIDRRGQITRKWIGPFTREALRTLLDEIVASEG